MRMIQQVRENPGQQQRQQLWSVFLLSVALLQQVEPVQGTLSMSWQIQHMEKQVPYWRSVCSSSIWEHCQSYLELAASWWFAKFLSAESSNLQQRSSRYHMKLYSQTWSQNKLILLFKCGAGSHFLNRSFHVPVLKEIPSSSWNLSFTETLFSVGRSE